MGTIDTNLLRIVSEDRALASAMLFPHRHQDESSPNHIEMIDLWRCAEEFVLIEAHREFGKSTLSEEFLTLEACFGNFHYALLLGETYSKACQRLAAIDYEARTNVRLHRLFGGKVLARKSIENKVWFRSGAMIEALGWEQELQSFKEHEHRPDRAYLDDPENLERVRDKAAVDASMRKLYLELIPAMDKKRRKIRITQTRRAEDCMVTRLAKNPEWVYRAYPICNGEVDDPRTKSNWPARYPMEWIRKEKATYQSQGMLAEFLQAYMLQTTDPGSKPFRQEMFKSEEVSLWDWTPKIAVYDPARTDFETRTSEHGKSDRYGKVVVSRRGSKILIHESEGRFWKPGEMIDDLFATHERHTLIKIIIEKNSLDDWLMHPIMVESMRRGTLLPVKAESAPQDRSKEDFIMGLHPFFEARDIVFVGGEMAHPQLVAEILNFPQGPRDIFNALAYALRMFSGQPVYGEFGPANVGEAPEAARGETVYVAFNATPNETVAAAMLRNGRRIQVAMDWSVSGPDAVRTIAAEMKAIFPMAQFSCWAPAELHDSTQRVPLVPRLRQANILPYRGEHLAVARGALSDRISREWQGKRLFTVDRRAKHTMNALASGYNLPVARGGRTQAEAEPGTSKLVGEAIESMVAILDRDISMPSIPTGANVAMTPGGVAYVTANPSRR